MLLLESTTQVNTLAIMTEFMDEIWLVDDDEIFRTCAKIVLKEEGFVGPIQDFQDARNTLTYLAQAMKGNIARPSIILLDINMPHMNSWQFLDKYKSFPEGFRRGIKVFILTSSIDPRDMQRSLNFKEVSGYLPKPLTESEVNLIRDHSSQPLEIDFN